MKHRVHYQQQFTVLLFSEQSISGDDGNEKNNEQIVFCSWVVVPSAFRNNGFGLTSSSSDYESLKADQKKRVRLWKRGQTDS